MTKKGWIFLILTTILALGVILGGFVFVARNFTIRDYDEEVIDSSLIVEIDDYVKSALDGKSMFSFSDATLTSQINKQFSTIRVVSIERTFPDVVKVIVRQRVESLAIATQDGYLVADFQYETKTITPIRYQSGIAPQDLVLVEGLDIGEYVFGSPLSNSESINKLSSILKIMYDVGYADTLPHIVRCIDINYTTTTSAIYMEGVGDNLTALVFDNNTQIYDQVLNLLSFYSSDDGSEYREGYILESRFNQSSGKYEVITYTRT